MFEKARILLYWARFGGLRLLTLRWQPHKRRLQGKWQCLLLVATCPQRTFLYCVRMRLHIIWWVMHYYWLLSKGRGGKTQSNRSMCVRVIRRHVQQYVCVHIAEDAGSSVGKVNWALCWVKAYSAQTKGPIKKKQSLLLVAEKPNTEWWCLPRSLRSAAWMITNGDFKRTHHSRSWVRLFPLRSKTAGETALEGCGLHADTRRRNLYIILTHWAVQSCYLGWFSTSREESASCQD